MTTVSVPGAELFYTARGKGPACLVLCSIGTKPYEIQMPSQLSDRLQLVFVDLRGGGRSTGEPSDLTFDVLASDLEAVRADLGVERLAVLGHSILGVLAIEYGRRCPASVSHVITVGTPPFGDMARVLARAASFFEEDASEERKQVLRDNLARLPADASMGQIMFAQTPMRFFDARIDAAPLFAEASAKPELIAHLLGPLTAGWDVTAASPPLRVPVFLAHGRHDYVVPYVLWEGIADRLPGATFRLFERSGHQPFFEEPEEFASALMDWMI
ncbi:MAG TPA: alpha/beta hydrolase [Actinomycetota bacterium]|jgi:proline iminopeptidase